MSAKNKSHYGTTVRWLGTMVYLYSLSITSAYASRYQYYFQSGEVGFTLDTEDGDFSADGHDERFSIDRCLDKEQYSCFSVEVMNVYVSFPKKPFKKKTWTTDGRTYCINGVVEVSGGDTVYSVISGSKGCDAGQRDSQFLFSRKRGLLSYSTSGSAATFVLMNKNGFK